MLLDPAVYGNVVIVCRVDPVILGPNESAMPCVYCYLPIHDVELIL